MFSPLFHPLLHFFPPVSSQQLGTSVALYPHFPKLPASRVGIQQEVPGPYRPFGSDGSVSAHCHPARLSERSDCQTSPKASLALLMRAFSPSVRVPWPLLPASPISNFACWRPRRGSVIVATMRKGGSRLRPFPHWLRETTPLPSVSPTVLGVLVLSSPAKLSQLQSLGKETDSERSLTERKRRDMGWCELCGSPECDL